MAHSESIAKLLPKLIAARLEMGKVVKDSTNPHYKSKYADLAGCLEACEPALAKHGLAVLQTTRWEDGVLTLETELAHDSGEWMRSQYPVICDYRRPQEIGAGLTYARRYSYLAITGRAPEDDDGEAASGRGANGHAQHAAPSNGRANGHANGAPKPAAPAPAPAPAPKPAPAPAPFAGTALMPVGDFEVSTAGGLRAWCRRIERVYGSGIAQHIAQRAAKSGWPESSNKWTKEQIEERTWNVRDNLEFLYARYRDEPGEFDEEGHS